MDTNSEVQFGKLIDLDGSKGNADTVDIRPTWTSTPKGPQVTSEPSQKLEPEEPSSLLDSIKQLHSLVLDLHSKTGRFEGKFDNLTARIDLMDSRVSSIEHQVSTSTIFAAGENKTQDEGSMKAIGDTTKCLQPKITFKTQENPSLKSNFDSPCAKVVTSLPIYADWRLPEVDGLNKFSDVHQRQPDATLSGSILQDKPKIRPSTFDGSGSWEDYIAHFEIVAELNRWDGATKATYLAISLAGPARAVLGDLDYKERKDVKTLMEALSARFGVANQTEVFRATLKSRSRNKDESLPELAQSIRRLTRQAYP